MKQSNKTIKYILFLSILIFAFTKDKFDKEEYKKKTFDFGYKEIIKEPHFKNLKMIGNIYTFGIQGKTPTIRLYGKILRTLRFQNITEKIEKKYNLPKNLLLAMIMQETGGADMLPNGKDDGGAGLCHMQPYIAHQFGLKIYTNSKKMRDKTLGKNLRKLIKKYNYDRKKLIKYDDRFHPIHNIDAVARMLVYYKTPKIKGFKKEWSSSIYRYAGRYNYRKYWQNINYFRKRLNDKKTIKEVEKMFNKLNTKLLINGKKGNFKMYIKTHQQQNINYGLNEYE